MTLANTGAADTLEAKLGDKTAGSYVDAQGKIVVTVTDPRRRTGRQGRRRDPEDGHPQSANQLAAASTELTRSAEHPRHRLVDRPGHQPGRRHLRRDGHRRQARPAQVGRGQARSTRSASRRRAGTLTTRIAGGDAIYVRRRPLLARLQRQAGRRQPLPDRRPLRQHRRDLVRQLGRHDRARHPRRHQLPGQRLRDRPVHRHRRSRPATSRCTTARVRTSPRPATPGSARVSAAAAAPPGSTAAG